MSFIGLGARRAKTAVVLISAGAVLCLLASPATAHQAPGLGQAKSVLLKKSDFPSGWIASGSVKTLKGSGGNSFFPPGTQALRQFGTCIGASSAMKNASSAPAVSSPGFLTDSGALIVVSVADVFPSASLAQQDYAMFANPKALACATAVEQARQRAAAVVDGAGAGIGNVTVTRPNPSWLVPHATGVTISRPITYYGSGTVTDEETVIFVVGGKIVSNLVVLSQGQQLPASLAHHLVATAYGRVSSPLSTT